MRQTWNYCNHSAGVALECAVHHERNVREEKHYIYVARTSNNRVISSGDLYCCLLPQCEALRTCRSGFPIATSSWLVLATASFIYRYYIVNIGVFPEEDDCIGVPATKTLCLCAITDFDELTVAISLISCTVPELSRWSNIRKKSLPAFSLYASSTFSLKSSNESIVGQGLVHCTFTDCVASQFLLQLPNRR